MIRRAVAAIALLAPLASCGDLPQPFRDRPGATATRLSQPPPARLAIPLPTQSLLTDDAAQSWSHALADALVAQELPVTASAPRPGDWHLLLTAEMQGGSVVPTYTVTDPHGVPQGASQGTPVPPADWAAGQPQTFKAAADEEAPKVVALLGGIEARREMSDPHSLLNRPPVIYFKGVTGAPGDGNTSLARQMVQHLPNQGDVVQDTPKGADYTLEGQIKTAPGAGGTLRIEIQWLVDDSSGGERGRVVQINEVPLHSLDSFWGDVAVTVATEAAGGVEEVINQASGRATMPAAAAALGPAKPAGAAAKPAGG